MRTTSKPPYAIGIDFGAPHSEADINYNADATNWVAIPFVIPSSNGYTVLRVSAEIDTDKPRAMYKVGAFREGVTLPDWAKHPISSFDVTTPTLIRFYVYRSDANAF